MDTNERAYYPVKWRVDLPSIACLLLGLGVVLAFFTGWILVIGSHVVHAWLLSSAPLATSLVIRWFGSRKQRGYNRDDQHRSWIRSCASILLVVAVATGSAGGATGHE